MRTSAVLINTDFLSDSPNKIWLQEHDLYDQFVDAQNLLDSLSELCLGNQITEKQLVNLMETGELFRSQEEKNAYAQEVAELQKKVAELDTKIDESITLENSLKSELENTQKQTKSMQSQKKSLYNSFIRGEGR